MKYFYPRPPRGGRLPEITRIVGGVDISIHALREEGDLDRAACVRLYQISIHALREEGDVLPSEDSVSRTIFLSTPSARRATHQVFKLNLGELISIHALREEGDLIASSIGVFRLDFYPRPPRGGRRWFLGGRERHHHISIHALREEGDLLLCLPVKPSKAFLSTPSARRATYAYCTYNSTTGIFLSTPSARRATAKTETKSLFSYKLYNILHEFRRALIYNGSNIGVQGVQTR